MYKCTFQERAFPYLQADDRAAFTKSGSSFHSLLVLSSLGSRLAESECPFHCLVPFRRENFLNYRQMIGQLSPSLYTYITQDARGICMPVTVLTAQVLISAIQLWTHQNRQGTSKVFLLVEFC